MLLAVLELPPPFLDEVELLDLGEKDETLLALPKLELSLHAASRFPVEPVGDPVGYPVKTDFRGMGSEGSF